MQTQTQTRSAWDPAQPLRLHGDQPEKWVNFGGEGISFHEAASRILAADAKDGTRDDLGIASLDTWAFGPTTDGVAALATIPAPGRERRLFPLRSNAFAQLCSRAGAPSSYIASLPSKLQMACVNHGMQQKARQNGNLVRLAGGEIRAILSDRYAPLDNHMVIEVLEKTLRSAGMLADVRVRSISTGLTASLRMTLPGSDLIIENPRKKGDIVEVGLDLLNNEVGGRAVSITPVLWRLACLNGMRSADRSHQQSLRHVGSAERLSEAFRDAVPAALAASRGMGQRMAKSVDLLVDDLLSEFEGLHKAFNLNVSDTRDVAADVLSERQIALPAKTDDWASAFAQAGSVSVFDVVNGITHVAQSRGTDRRLEMEEAAHAYLRRRTR